MFALSDAGTDSTSSDARAHWGVDSEYGRLTDVMMSVPLPGVHGADGDFWRPPAAGHHRRMVEAMEAAGVRVHLAPPRSDLYDFPFTRDPALMTPWGLLELKMGDHHRRSETAYAHRIARGWGVPITGTFEGGLVEGGDVCIARPGLVIIGYSGDRTTFAGANALAQLFESRGWRAILHPFHPRHLHIDTFFTMIGKDEAVGCLDLLEPWFVRELDSLGIGIIPATLEEVELLGANLVSLGERRVVSPGRNRRINAELERRGYQVVEVEIEEFARHGGGIHCLTLPLARDPG